MPSRSARVGFVRARAARSILNWAVLFLPSILLAAPEVTLVWNPNPEEDIAGYVVRYGTARGSYSVATNVGLVTTHRLAELSPGVTYYFVVSAYNFAGLESDPSREVAFTPQVQPDGQPLLVGFWDFEERAGLTAADRSGNGNHATLRGGVAWDVGPQSGGAVSFDGLDDYLEVSDADMLEVADTSFTLAMWVRTSRPQPQTLIEKQSIDPRALFLLVLNRVDAVRGGFSLLNGEVWLDSNTRGVADGAWHHLAVSYHAGRFALYFDGSLDREFTLPATYASTPFPLNFGSFRGGLGAWPFRGLMDEIRFYRRPLAEDEIRALTGAPSQGGNGAGVQQAAPLPARLELVEWDANRIRVTVRSLGGEPLEASFAQELRLRSSSSFSGVLSDWSRLADPPLFNSGVAEWVLPRGSQQFFLLERISGNP